jgi:hypothetical protein
VNTRQWIFTRGDERLELSREDLRTGANLVVGGADGARTIHFATVERLERFQSDMEKFLLQTGWRFSEFSPERRSGSERRGFPRMAERRRWWTDSVRLFTRRVTAREPSHRF